MPNPLILGGTTEATALANAMAGAGVQGIFSYAGRVARPKRQPLPTRVGGFGGVEGLAAYLRDQSITHVIDATHPFASQMSRNAIAACALVGVPLVALTRPAWQAEPGDRWHRVPNIPAAVAALEGPVQSVMLAVGRMHLAEFATQPQHRYLLRLVDAPDGPLPFPKATAVVDQGPFSVEGDTALMRDHGIELLVSKNSGGSGARAKIIAARALGLPILMIDRPALPDRPELGQIGDVLDWLGHFGTERGV